MTFVTAVVYVCVCDVTPVSVKRQFENIRDCFLLSIASFRYVVDLTRLCLGVRREKLFRSYNSHKGFFTLDVAMLLICYFYIFNAYSSEG